MYRLFVTLLVLFCLSACVGRPMVHSKPLPVGWSPVTIIIAENATWDDITMRLREKHVYITQSVVLDARTRRIEVAVWWHSNWAVDPDAEVSPFNVEDWVFSDELIEFLRQDPNVVQTIKEAARR